MMDVKSALILIDALFDEIQDSIDNDYVLDSITPSQKEALSALASEMDRFETLRGIEEKFQKAAWIDDGIGGRGMNADTAFAFLEELQGSGFSIEQGSTGSVEIPKIAEAGASPETKPYRGEYYVMSEKTRAIIKRDIEPKLDPEFLEHVPEMVEILKEGLVDDSSTRLASKEHCPRCGSIAEFDARAGECSYCDHPANPSDHERCAGSVDRCKHCCPNCGRYWTFEKRNVTWIYGVTGTLDSIEYTMKECPKCDGGPRSRIFHADPRCEYCHGEYYLPAPVGMNVDPPLECPACKPAYIAWQFNEWKIASKPVNEQQPASIDIKKNDKKPSIKVKNEPLVGIVTNVQSLRRYRCPKCGDAYPLKKIDNTYWECDHCEQAFRITASHPEPLTIEEYMGTIHRRFNRG